MEIFTIIGLLICVIICLIAVFKTEKQSREKLKNKEYSPQFETMDEDDESSLNTLENIFRRFYKLALIVAKKSSINNNPEFELLPALYTICEFATSELQEDNGLEIMDNLIDLFYNVYPELDAGMLSKRLNLYGEVTKNKRIRFLWAYGNKNAFNDNLISNCAAIWGDITCNPKCAEDYYNAPIFIHDAFILMGFTQTVKLINKLFIAFFKDFYQNIVLPNLPSEYVNKK